MKNPTAGGTEPSVVPVDGLLVNLKNQIEAVAGICSAAQGRESFTVFTLNLDHLVKLRQSASLRAAYRTARFITADGAPVARLASRNGVTVARTTGADLVAPLAEEAAKRGLSIFLLGTTADVLAKAARSLAERTGQTLDIVGTFSPSRDFDAESAEADLVLDRVAQSGAHLCLIALGAPKQEILAARGVQKGIPAGFVCIGAALDFIAGAQIRAPRVMQQNGLEWVWRMFTNPVRLSGRYARCLILLAELVLWQPLRSRLMRAAS